MEMTTVFTEPKSPCNVQIAENTQETKVFALAGDTEVTVHVAAHATCTVLCLQTEEADLTLRATLGEGATVHWQIISLAPVTATLENTLKGNHAVSNVDWVFYAKGSEKQKISAQNTFAGREGGGKILMKGVAEDTAHVDCNGMIAISLTGGGTDTYLTEDVLMLDSTAKVDAIPGLEIKTNDVKASHSATVSRVTEEDLFYFAARGIDEKTARHMYILGYVSEIAGKIADETMREQVVAAIERKYLK